MNTTIKQIILALKLILGFSALGICQNSDPENFQLTVVNDTICFGASSGALTANTTSATLPVLYEWSNSETGPTISNLAPGTYSVTATDRTGQRDSATAVVVEQPLIFVNVVQTPPDCHNGRNASLEIVGVRYGGISQPLNDFSFRWNSIPTQFSVKATNLVATQNYTVTVTDQRGCSGLNIQTIINPPKLDIQANLQPPDCSGEASGSITLDIDHGKEPYSYKWEHQNSATRDSSITGLTAGNYTVQVVDSAGCTNTAQFQLIDPPLLEQRVVSSAASCRNEPSGRITLEPEGGTPPYRFEWNHAQSLDQSRATDLFAGTYSVTTYDANGCALAETVLVREPETALGLDFTASDPRCLNGLSGQLEVEALGGTPPYRYSLDGNSFLDNPNFIGLPAGDYSVWVRDFNGCLALEENISLRNPLPLSVELPPDTTIKIGEQVQLSAKLEHSVGPTEYSWSVIEGDAVLDCTDCFDPLVESIAFRSIIYLSVTDSLRCIAEDQQTIFITKQVPLLVPTGFSPNGDGNNDMLRVLGDPTIHIRSFQVFDRYNQLIYEAKDLNPNDSSVGWDGQFRGEDAPAGVYIWWIEAEPLGGAVFFERGQTTLIR